LKARCGRVVNYNLDDPTGRRDGRFWFTFKRAVPAHDLCVVVRDESFREFTDLGARDVMQVFRSYDEVAHAPLPHSREDEARWSSPVVFVGTWMPERGEFLSALLRAGVPLAIHGNRWEKSPQWRELRHAWRSAAVVGADYVKAIQYARVSLGLLSHGNRDLHTQRTAEIPFIGGLFCAERTREHEQLFRDGAEAVFWNDAAECASRCRWLLENPSERDAIAAAGRRRVQQLGIGNEEMVAQVLERATATHVRKSERSVIASCR
jgi:spore maturation protein CgeB